MYKAIVALLLVAAVANSQLVGWRNCGSHLATIHRMRLIGCSQTPCAFPIGHVVPIEVDATSHTNTNNLPFALSASLFGLPIPVLQGNACNHLILGSCPALNGHDFTFRLEYNVTDILPPMPVTITATVWNDFGDVGICLEVDVITLPATN